MLLLSACTNDVLVDEPKAVDGTMIAADLRGNEWVLADLASGAVTERFSLSDVEPGVCEGEDQLVYCLLFEAIAAPAPEGGSQILYTWSELDVSDGDDNGPEDLLSRVAAVDAERFEERWRFRYLDFSAVPGVCPYDPEDPCHPPAGLSASEVWGCSMHMAHTVALTDETDTSVSMWVVDSRNSRMLHVEAPKDGDCAVVDTVIDRERHPDWDIYNSVNSVDRREIDGQMTLLMSVKGSFPADIDGLSQNGGESQGKIVLWSEEPAQLWEYPPETTDSLSFFNTPHGVQWLDRPNGERWVVFAHSLGAAERNWGLGSGGSVGVLRMTDDGPEYLYDAILPPDQGTFRFPRDVTPLPDGRVVVTDSGCLGDGCVYETALWVLDLPDAEARGLSGVWSEDHSQQHFVKVKADAGPLLEEMNLLYSANLLSE